MQNGQSYFVSFRGQAVQVGQIKGSSGWTMSEGVVEFNVEVDGSIE